MSDDVVVLGRFQPLHRGHERLLDYAEANYDTSYVLVGDYGERTSTDPLLYDERRRIVTDLYPRAEVHRGHDTGDDDRTMELIERVVPESFTALTGSTWTKELFEAYDYPVEPFPEGDFDYHASDIRERIRTGRSWEHLVPSPVFEQLQAVDFEQHVLDTRQEDQ